jgi:hypothetical protein
MDTGSGGGGDADDNDSDVFIEDEDMVSTGSISESMLDSDKEGDNAGKSTATVGQKRKLDRKPDLDLGQSYRTIRAAKKAASSLRPLNPAPKKVCCVSTGSFLTEGDDRIRNVNIEHNLQARTSKTLSFDPVNLLCNTCLAGKHAAVSAAGGGPVAIVASDQSFPACMPARTAKKECIRVIRIEDASLQDLTHALADALGKVKLAPGTVILLGSVAHLALCGTEHYITDWVRSRWWLKERLGDAVVVVPLAPILVGGVQGRSIIRSLVESLHWFTSLSATEAVLMKGIMHGIIGTQFTCKDGLGWEGDRQCFRLPAGLDTKATVAMVSEGWHSLPESVPPLSPAAEKAIVVEYINMLNDAFGLNLDLDPCLARSAAEIAEQRESDATAKFIAVVGNSHARRLATELEALGNSVVCLNDKGWSLSKRSIEAAIEALSEMEEAPDLLIVYGLDNNSFFVSKEDGTLTIPAKGRDKKYHVDGDLRVATREQTVSLLRIMKPLLDAEPEIAKILVTPIPRYAHEAHRCCADPEHCSNSGQDLIKEVRAGLATVKKTARSFIFSEKLSGVRIMDPNACIDTNAVGNYADPVHLVQDRYRDLARKVIEMLAGLDVEDSAADHSTSKPNNNKRIRVISASARGSGSGSGTGRGIGATRGRSFGGRGGRGGRRPFYGRARFSL